MPLGAMETAKYCSIEFQLKKADLLIAMSDGLPERINNTGEQFGYSHLVTEIHKNGKTAKNAKALLQHLVQASDDWSNHTPQHDDVTLVVLKVK